ncbi:long-chain fatty acid-CoA ligase, partial [Kappamyces sp. JEL0680]
MGLITNTILWLLLGIAIPVLLLRSKLGKSLSWPTAEKPTKTDGVPRRSFLVGPEQPLRSSPHSTVKTLYDVLLYGARVYPASKHLFGTREVRNVIKETKTVKKIVNGEEVSEDKVVAKVNDYGSALVKLGLKKQDKVTIFHSTSADWMTMSYACYSQNIMITTAYDSLGVEALAYSLNEGEVPALFTQVDLLHVVKQIGSKVPTLKHIIYSGKPVGKEELAALKESNPALDFYSLDELRALGKANPVPPNPPSPDDLACIMYTSGSTGNPKGVMISHRNMIAGCAGCIEFLNICKGVLDGTDYYLGYLPLAHVLEFLVENFCVFKGVSIGYGSPKTLTDASVRNCKGDIKEL